MIEICIVFESGGLKTISRNINLIKLCGSEEVVVDNGRAIQRSYNPNSENTGISGKQIIPENIYISMFSLSGVYHNPCDSIVLTELYLLEDNGDYIPLDETTNNDRFEFGEVNGANGLIISTTSSYMISNLILKGSTESGNYGYLPI